MLPAGGDFSTIRGIFATHIWQSGLADVCPDCVQSGSQASPLNGRLMLLDFEIQRSTRRCAATDRKLEPGEAFFSTLNVEGPEVVRRDWAAEAWQGPPDGVFGWWKSRVPLPDAQQPKLAPNEVLLELFDHLADQADNCDMRYVLALLLVRRRLLRIEDRLPQGRGDGVPLLVVHCPASGETHEIPEAPPDGQRLDAIQDQLVELLYADAA